MAGVEQFDKPPFPTNADGKERCVGVEIEFGSIDAERAARLVQSLFGGTLEKHNPNAFDVKDTAFGDFEVKLDTRLASYDDKPSGLLHDIKAELGNLLGAAASLVVPLEIVTPPIGVSALQHIETLLSRLRRLGASGTEDSVLFAFGLHLNPEAPRLDAPTITAILKAYALASPWLWRAIDPDSTRRFLRFADPFPEDYVKLIVDDSYWPDMPQLIDDYLASNPTRNRDLDMLPLFALLDESRVCAKLPDEKINRRPTFHYRLPDMDLHDSNWGLATEWNRWVAVERLAADEERLVRLGRAFRSGVKSRDDWAARSAEFGFA